MRFVGDHTDLPTIHFVFETKPVFVFQRPELAGFRINYHHAAFVVRVSRTLSFFRFVFSGRLGSRTNKPIRVHVLGVGGKEPCIIRVRNNTSVADMEYLSPARPPGVKNGRRRVDVSRAHVVGA